MKIKIEFSIDVEPELFAELVQYAQSVGLADDKPNDREAVRRLMERNGTSAVGYARNRIAERNRRAGK